MNYAISEDLRNILFRTLLKNTAPPNDNFLAENQIVNYCRSNLLRKADGSRFDAELKLHAFRLIFTYQSVAYHAVQ